jgi:hypothetical protein
MSTLALTLADFTKALPFSNKIEDRQIQPFVAESYTLDLVPLLGYSVLEAVDQLTVPEVLPFVFGVPRTANAYYLRRERVYRSAADVPAPAPDEAELVYEPLLTLWTQYLKPYWIRASFTRFLPQHGQDFTKGGVTTPTDPGGTFRPVTSTEKATLLAAHETVTEALRSRLTAFRNSESTLSAGHSCGSATPSHRTRIRGINSARHARPRY